MDYRLNIKCPESVNSTVITQEDILVLTKHRVKYQWDVCSLLSNDSEKISVGVCGEAVERQGGKEGKEL